MKKLQNKLLFAPVDPTKPFAPLQRHYPGDAGYDLTVSQTVTVFSRQFAMIASNVKVAFPHGVWGMIVGRSSTFYKRNLIVSPAIIDSGFRGELWATVYNPTDESISIRRGDRLIQLILFSLVTPEVCGVATKELPSGDREEKGFGSTGGHVEDGAVKV